MPISRDAVIWGYRIILGREPNSESEIKEKMELSSYSKLVNDLFHQNEFFGSRRYEFAFSKVLKTDNQLKHRGQISRDAVIWCYRLFLGREPESEGVIKEKMRLRDEVNLMRNFVQSDEYVRKSVKESRYDELVLKNKKEIGSGEKQDITNKLELALTPRTLGSQLNNLKFLLLGTCQVEYLAGPIPHFGSIADHFNFDFFDPRINIIDPSIKVSNYDVVIIGLTFRNILRAALGVNTEVFHVRTLHPDDLLALVDRCITKLQVHIAKIHEALKSRPTFFMSVLEPSFNYLGNLTENYHQLNMRTFVRKFNDNLDKILRELNNFYLFDMNEIFNFVGRMHLQDDITLHFTHNSIIHDNDDNQEFDNKRLVSPVSIYSLFDTKSQLTILRTVIFNTLSDNLKILRRLDTVKLIIIDLDDTLWRGVAVEESEENFEWPLARNEGWPLGFVEALLYFKRRGGLLAICSKNDYESIVMRFKKIWRDEITMDDFVSIKINWKSKPDNIAAILSKVNILPENVLFIDDNPRELDEIKSRYPGIRCLGGNHMEWRRIILRSPETQVPFISEESQQRTQLVRAQIERVNTSGGMSRDDWLQSLNLEQKIILVKDTQNKLFRRAIELINKTNQFNTTGKRWSISELEEFFNSGGVCLLSSLKDKTVDNGIIGAVLLRANEIVQVVLSCRVFGLGAEIGMGRIATLIGLSNNKKVYAKTINTGKNFTCHNYFESLGFVGSGGTYVAYNACSHPGWIKVEVDQTVEFASKLA